MAKNSKNTSCPCGGADYLKCCGRFIEDGEIPATAEELMRSRYTAYTLQKEDYLRATWHGSTRPSENVAQDGAKWLGLEVRRHAGSVDEATVEFVARYRLGAQGYRLHEVSRFVREGGRWYYVDGEFPGKVES
jgi:SEC-C motif-containing protein